MPAPPKFANVVVRFKKGDPFWSSFIKRIEPRMTHEGQDVLTVSFMAKHYDLADHQFVRVKVNFNKRDTIIQLPRNLVSVIIEGKALDEGTLGFLAGKQNS